MSKYVVLEGVDGVGKSTLAKMLAEAMPATLTREPGSPHISLRVRDIILAKDSLPRETVELLLHADRNAHTLWVEKELGTNNVVSDRSFVSGLAYGLANGLQQKWLLDLTMKTVHVWPDVIVVLSSNKSDAVIEARKQPTTREEGRGSEFSTKLSHFFTTALELTDEFLCSSRIVSLDVSNDTPEQSLARVMLLV